MYVFFFIVLSYRVGFITLLREKSLPSRGGLVTPLLMFCLPSRGGVITPLRNICHTFLVGIITPLRDIYLPSPEEIATMLQGKLLQS